MFENQFVLDIASIIYLDHFMLYFFSILLVIIFCIVVINKKNSSLIINLIAFLFLLATFTVYLPSNFNLSGETIDRLVEGGKISERVYDEVRLKSKVSFFDIKMIQYSVGE